VSDEVHGTVTVRMRHVPWDQALEAIALSKGLRIVHVADVILVLPNAK
jgi:type IV pilus assembly protein PilQ